VSTTANDDSIATALVDVRSGRIAPGSARVEGDEQLAELAPIVAELYAADHAAWAYAAFERALDAIETSSLEEIVLVSPTHVRVMQRLPSDPDRVLAVVGRWEQQPGAVVATAREALARREGQ
jgi:hypothetical protein